MQTGVELADLSPASDTLPTVAPGVLQAPSTAGLKSVVGGYQLTEFGQRRRFALVTLCFLGLTLLIALSITDLGTVLAFVGATGSIAVSYILPGFFYYFIFREEGPAWKRHLALAQGVLGLLLMPLCLTFIFI
jgi:amino acid permease